MAEKTNQRPRVILTIGLPGSGKSTYIKRAGITPLSSDTLRQWLIDDPTDQSIHYRVFLTLRYLLRHRLALRRPITYIDATNLTADERRPYIAIAQLFGADVEALFFDIPVEVCIERNQRRHRNVPEEAIRTMHAKLVPPAPEEGFSKITVVRVEAPTG
jgi:predicted kinase